MESIVKQLNFAHCFPPNGLKAWETRKDRVRSTVVRIDEGIYRPPPAVRATCWLLRERERKNRALKHVQRERKSSSELALDKALALHFFYYS